MKCPHKVKKKTHTHTHGIPLECNATVTEPYKNYTDTDKKAGLVGIL